ncbi:MAG: bifunctional (p)ppGpp synthetase/guanosine-3',5'-bis(diphosphate) 3'-pyrophosphohydrolase, partial [Alphaproteobacteria bacterium]|nr:bifunctional (p)ppGpp synthetase/guanosine-3',5'-bis(diphosphate) 3'-pyrophosphohydrolase [Alphaproteobacteria bacterium]
LRTQQREEYIVLGKEILEKTFQQEGVEFNEKVLAPALKIFNKTLVDDIYAEVGEGVLTRNQVLEAVFPGRKEEAKPKGFSLFQRRKKTTKSGDHAIPVKGLIPGMAVHFAGCCHPLPGDRIVGIVVTGKGITIHTIDCDTLENFTDTPERWISVSWDEATSYQDAYVGRIRATVSHESGSLATIANIIAKDLGNITNLKILNRSPDFFDLMIDIEVEGVQHLTNIIAALRSSSVVQSVERHHE